MLCVIVKKEKRQNYGWKIFDELSASSGLYDLSVWQILLVLVVLLGGQFLADFLRKEIGLITFTTKTNNDRNFEIYGLTIRKRIESGLKWICSFAGWKWFSRREKIVNRLSDLKIMFNVIILKNNLYELDLFNFGWNFWNWMAIGS